MVSAVGVFESTINITVFIIKYVVEKKLNKDNDNRTTKAKMTQTWKTSYTLVVTKFINVIKLSFHDFRKVSP